MSGPSPTFYFTCAILAAIGGTVHDEWHWASIMPVLILLGLGIATEIAERRDAR